MLGSRVCALAALALAALVCVSSPVSGEANQQDVILATENGITYPIVEVTGDNKFHFQIKAARNPALPSTHDIDLSIDLGSATSTCMAKAGDVGKNAGDVAGDAFTSPTGPGLLERTYSLGHLLRQPGSSGATAWGGCGFTTEGPLAANTAAAAALGVPASAEQYYTFTGSLQIWSNTATRRELIWTGTAVIVQKGIDSSSATYDTKIYDLTPGRIDATTTTTAILRECSNSESGNKFQDQIILSATSSICLTHTITSDYPFLSRFYDLDVEVCDKDDNCAETATNVVRRPTDGGGALTRYNAAGEPGSVDKIGCASGEASCLYRFSNNKNKALSFWATFPVACTNDCYIRTTLTLQIIDVSSPSFVPVSNEHPMLVQSTTTVTPLRQAAGSNSLRLFAATNDQTPNSPANRDSTAQTPVRINPATVNAAEAKQAAWAIGAAVGAAAVGAMLHF